MKTNGIYIIRNLVNDKRYIGSSVCLARRLGNHKYELNKNKHHNIKLQNSWNKHGADAFVFEVVETLPEFLSEKQVRGIEQFFISTSDWDNLYNIAEDVSCSCPSAETVDKIVNTIRNNSKSKGIEKCQLKDSIVYRVKIHINRQGFYLGTFDTYEEALAARLEGEEKYWVRNEPYERPSKKPRTNNHCKKSGGGVYQQKKWQVFSSILCK